jgi:hypothetical protein
MKSFAATPILLAAIIIFGGLSQALAAVKISEPEEKPKCSWGGGGAASASDGLDALLAEEKPRYAGCLVLIPGGGFVWRPAASCEECQTLCKAFYPDGTVEDGTAIECGTTSPGDLSYQKEPSLF